MAREIQSFVLRKGKMSKGQKYAYQNYNEKWVIPFKEEILDFSSYFGDKKVTLEIGFGMGDATWQIARNNPERGFLGLEVHKPGVGKLLSHIESENLSNLYIIEYDAVKVINKMIPDKALQGVHIFFPDPWPKKKHHKRRIIQHNFVQQVLDRVASGGYLYIVTDWEPYAKHIKEVMKNQTSINADAKGVSEPQSWRPETAFERKGLAKDHRIFEFYYEKK